MMQSNTVGAFDLKTTVEDLARWDRTFQDNRLRDGPQVRAFLKRGHLDNRNVLEADPQETYRGLPRNWYTGGGPSYFAQMLRFPTQKFSVILLCNLAEEREWRHMTGSMKRIADLFLADHLRPAPPRDPRWGAAAATVKVPESELRDRAGLYRAAGGLFHRLVLKGGQLFWVSPFQHSYPLLPLGRARFRSAESPLRFDLEFTRPRPDGPCDVKLTDEEGGEVRWQPVEEVTPTPRQLARYAGAFFSEDLQASYRFSVHRGGLALQINNGARRPLRPMIADVFIPSDRSQADWIITFVRGERGAVAGCRIDLDRVRGVRFEKLQGQ
jgi:hypothetical protein